jgi:hypothetical protein
VSFDPAAFKAELQRELAVPQAAPVPARALSVEVVAVPPPRRWRMTPVRDEDSGLILWVDLEARE